MATFAGWILPLLSLAPAADPNDPDQRELTERLYFDGREHEAAERFEALLTAGSTDLKVLATAAEARLHLGHHAHAWRHFQALFASDRLAPSDRRTKDFWYD